MTQPFTAENLSALSPIRHAFFTRKDGNGGFYLQENPEDVYKSRAHMANYLHVAPQNLISCYQIHSPDVITLGVVAGSSKGVPQSSCAHLYVTEIWDGDHRPKADALVTNKSGIALGVLTADCVPVLFADDQARVIGAAHAGWRGAIGGVLENTIEAMEKLGADRRVIHAAIGPCIWQNSYEVSDDFLAPFIAEDSNNETFFCPGVRSGHFMFDLPGYVKNKLQKLGVTSVAPSPADTCADPETFYSHRYCTLRNEKRTGNLMSAITLADQ